MNSHNINNKSKREERGGRHRPTPKDSTSNASAMLTVLQQKISHDPLLKQMLVSVLKNLSSLPTDSDSVQTWQLVEGLTRHVAETQQSHVEVLV